MDLKNINVKEIPGKLGAAFGHLRLSLLESVFLLAALGFAGFVGYFYFNEVRPLNGRIGEIQTEINQINVKVIDDRKRLAELEKQRQNAERILDSLFSFARYLHPGETGKAAIIDDFEAMAKKNKIVTGDFAFKPIEAQQLVDDKGQLLKEVARDSSVQVYPAMGIETAVIGDYPNLRRFLADVEKSRHFLVVNALSFQGEADKTRAAASNKGRAPQLDSPDAIPVTLKIEMETYFDKQN